MFKMKLNKDLCVMAIAGVITLGNVAEGSIEQFKAEQEAAKKTKKPLLVLPNAPESAEEQSSDAGTIGEGMSPDEVSEKSEASTEQTEGLCLLRVVKNDSSEASCEPIDEDTQYPLGHCYIFGAKTKSQDLGCETQEEPYYSEDPVKRKLWEKQLKKAGFPILETEDIVLPNNDEDLLKFKKRLAGMELNAETKRRSFEKACGKRAEANEILWCSLLDDEISQKEIEDYLNKNLSAEQKKKMGDNSPGSSYESQVESYKKLVYALLKFGLSADEILAVNYSYLPLFNYLNEAGENTEEFYQCYCTDNDGESDFNGKGIPKEEKLLLIKLAPRSSDSNILLCFKTLPRTFAPSSLRPQFISRSLKTLLISNPCLNRSNCFILRLNSNFIK